ncbi:uncharacterized protein LOC106642495 [Copidosoma floridanum]|uniref:uncharacterized protein LOC106642495 n=1 Tax=Copidosoma floridanum TaxID=29053 RepID=UPI0006C96347|nr:uncharacterized protein LOC106642495 [Copidosoma floridanum]
MHFSFHVLSGQAGGTKKKKKTKNGGKDNRPSCSRSAKKTRTPAQRADCSSSKITSTWRDVKQALSLLCVKTSTSSAAMLEAPPGSREDLVEAARTPCSPSELDTMLYGYTNSIYVLDHTPESLPEVDMLQLFASPAGRALVRNSSRDERQPQQQQGSSTSSLSRGFGSGSSATPATSMTKEGRRKRGAFGKSNKRLGKMGGTMSAPASPPARQRKSSTELYKEAVEILGLTCKLSDSCRCIDCQSSYFQYDDECETRPELAAGTPVLLDHALTHPLACSIQ